MGRFYLAFQKMLEKFGVDIWVYPDSEQTKTAHYHYVGGIRVPEQAEEPVEEIKRHEPVFPYNSNSSFMAQFLAGGELAQADLLWLSCAQYPINTKVRVPSQKGTFRIVNFANYCDYSDVVIYELKGDDQHPNG